MFANIDLGYRFTGLAGLYHLRGYDWRKPDTHWDVYALAGVGRLRATAAMPVDLEHSTQAFFGAGIEKRFPKGWALRLQLATYDEDASLLHVGILKRFGARGQARASQEDTTAQQTVAEQPAQESVDEQQALAVAAASDAVADAVTALDSDGDGVLDENDLCPDSAPGAAVDRSGCADASAALDNILFAVNSAELTPTGLDAVAELADILRRYPERQVIIEAHTDSQGSEAYNLDLSARRAASVREALIAEGIPAERLSSQGKGESEPVADNATAEGRARNRRVEFVFREDGAQPVTGD